MRERAGNMSQLAKCLPSVQEAFPLNLWHEQKKAHKLFLLLLL